MDGSQCGGAFGFSFLLEQGASGQHDIAAFSVVFQYLEIEGFPHHFIQIANRAQIRLRSWQKCLDTDIHRKTAFNARQNNALNHLVIIMGFLDIVPYLDLGGFFFGKNDDFVFIIPPFHHDLNRIAGLDDDIPILIPKFVNSDLTLGFVSDIHQHMIFIYRNDTTRNHFTLGKAFETLLVHFHQVVHAFRCLLGIIKRVHLVHWNNYRSLNCWF